MKIDNRALKMFNIKKEIWLISLCKLMSFLSFLCFTYNFTDLLFKILNNEFSNKYLTIFLVKLIVVFILFYFSLRIDNKISHNISKKVRNTLRKKIFHKLEKLSLNYTEAVSTNNLMVMNSTSIVSIELYFNKFLPQVLATFLIIITSLVIFGSINIFLVVAMIFLYPLIPISIMLIMKKSKKTNKKTFSDFLSLSDVFFDRLKGFEVAKIYGKEDNINFEIDKRSENYRKSTMTLLKHQLNSINIMDAFTYFSIFIMSIIAIFTINNPALIIFIIVASFECFRPLRALGSLFHITMKSSVELDNIYKLLDYEEIKKDNSIILEEGQNITLNNVKFSYNNKNEILKNINIKLKKSSKVALVGESGSGKSTIIKLIMGLNKANSGEVLYGDINIDKIPYKEISKILTVINSDSYLQSGTIREHLKINDTITEKEMYSALEKVNLKDLILENDGLDFIIDEGAKNLSGGQKQRLLSAKAILKNSYIYVLDEAVSNIDEYSKNCVLNAFDSIKKDKIIIIISHDLSSLENCDNIYVLKEGELYEEGTNKDLIKNNKLYANLLSEQLKLKNKFLEKEAI